MRDGNAAVDKVAVGGPYESHGPGDTPSRRAIFSCQPATNSNSDEERCAQEILSGLARRAYRRPLEEFDLSTLMNFYRMGRSDGSFDAGIQLALERLLISPDFLFRVERDPIDSDPGTIYVNGFRNRVAVVIFFVVKWS